MPHILCKKTVASMLLLFFINYVTAQEFVILIDGSNRPSDDTLQLISDNPITGINTFNFGATVKSGKTNAYKIKADAALLMRFDDAGFLVGKNDSVHIAYNPAAKKYEIDGGRFPGNYTIYQAIMAVRLPFETYKKAEDNYNEYVKQVDSATSARYNMLKNAWESRSISEDVYRYVTGFIKYAHLYMLLRHRSSPAFKKQFPHSPSQYVAGFSKNEFQNHEYAGIMEYVLAGVGYTNTIAGMRDSSNFRYYAVDYAISNFTGTTRNMLLHALLINFGFAERINKRQLQELLERIKALNLPEPFFKPIKNKYVKVMIEGQLIDTAVLAGSRLRTMDGKEISFQQLQKEVLTGKKVLIDFWASWCGPCIRSLPAVRKMEKDFTVVYISLDTDMNKWKAAARKHQIDKDQYGLINNYNNPLALYLLITSIPRYVVLDPSGVVTHVELQITHE